MTAKQPARILTAPGKVSLRISFFATASSNSANCKSP